MRTRAMRRVTARYTWDRLRVSFWFAPAVMTVVAIPLAWAMYWLDGLIPNEALQNSRFILSGSVETLRSFLLNTAAIILTTTGVVFTLLTLPLSTVAAQYGSRLLRVFLSDRTTQIVLGIFVGTFVYCLAAAAAIQPVEVQPDGPQITATVGIYFMLVSFGCLILLIQHISTMLQAPKIAAIAGAELLDVVSVDVPDEVGSNNDQVQTGRDALAALVEAEAYPLRARKTGYIQYIDPDYILTLAQAKNLVIHMLRKPGHFVRPGTVLAMVWPAGHVNKDVEEQIHHALQIGNQRTPTQDIEYAVNQLVEMAVRAMSPAINDPFTAMTCLDYLGHGLAIFARQGGENANAYDQAGHLRLIIEPVSFNELLTAAFEMLRHASNSNAAVLAHMLEVIDKINQDMLLPEVRQELLRQVYLIEAESQASNLIEADKDAISQRSEILQQKLSMPL